MTVMMMVLMISGMIIIKIIKLSQSASLLQHSKIVSKYTCLIYFHRKISNIPVYYGPMMNT